MGTTIVDGSMWEKSNVLKDYSNNN